MTHAMLFLLLAAPVPVPASMKCGGAGAHPLEIAVHRSAIRWRGTKFWGLGKHEGVVAFRAGELCLRTGQVVGGWFEADMKTIDVTDIPESDPIPRKRLRDHLLSEDFFHVARHPLSSFVIRSIREEKPRLYLVTGDLTIRARTHPVTFYARVWTLSDAELKAEARFKIDRHQFGVRYVGSTLKDDLVDDDFWLELEIEARRP